MGTEFRAMDKENKRRCCFKTHQSHDVFRKVSQLTCKACVLEKTMSMQNCQKHFCSKCPKPRQVYLYGTFLNTKVIQSERHVASPVLPQRELCVRLRIPLCAAGVYFCTSACEIITRNFVRDDFVSCRASQQQRCSPEVLTHVAFISLVGYKGPLQWSPVCF